MASRSPDGSRFHLQNDIGLGHGLLATARNGLSTHPADLMATLDGRFDRREELAAQLGLTHDLGDADLLLAAYARWDMACLDRIDGDYAFILWDGRQRRLLAARDRLGVRPLYYARCRGTLFLASHPAALLAAHPELADAIDEEALAAYAAGEALPLERTVHAGIRRLPPAHALIADTGFEVRRTFEWPREARRKAEPPEAFAALLSEAVRERLPLTDSAAALLSGGLDSSSIVALGAAAREEATAPKLRTYSQVFPGSRIKDERHWIESVVFQSGARATYVPSSEISAFAGFDLILNGQCAPFIAPNIAVTSHTMAQVARDGIRVLVDGHGGDEVVWHGIPALYDLAYSGRMPRLWAQLQPLAKAEGQSALRLFSAVMASKGPHRRWLGATGRRARPPLTDTRPAWLIGESALARAKECAPGREAIDGHTEALTGGYFVQSLEVLDKLAGSHGLDLRFPFLDRRLVEWCLTAAPEERLAEGYTRSLLRQGMKGIIPEMVRTRRDKYDFMAQLVDAMIDRDEQTVDDVLNNPDERLAGCFEMDELRRLWARLKADRNSVRGRDVQAIWRAVMMGLWLRRARQPSALAMASIVKVPSLPCAALGAA